MPPPGSKPDGVFLHIHGGGHVLAHCDWFDDLLLALATTTNLTVISPEYCLAPENPFPAGPSDVYDVATHLVDHSPSTYGGPLKFIAGDSAGAMLSMLTVLHLLKARPDFAFQGAAFIYGLFDWSLSPSAGNWTTPLIMRTSNIEHFGDAYLGSRTLLERRDPAISPLYHEVFQYPASQIEDLEALKTEGLEKRPKLPPALFLCGTLDPVVDDTVLMSFRYQVAGGEAVVKFVEGGPHGFLLFPEEQYESARIGKGILLDFLRARV
ncbi:Acetyl esterase [Lachnellula suecica]|uniref:Acetyl esterase n=1 Tax=Lachnellula suecica TaxID=602035 RepID=A0A8T9C031_9HELO|nr:Acetyl esterase [Lachnellula suecica]